MKLEGQRVHLSGTAGGGVDAELLANAHAFVGELIRGLAASGCGIVLGAGAEPVEPESGLGLVFDWTALAAIAAAPTGSVWPRARPGRYVVVASQRAIEKIPEARRSLWERLAKREDFALKSTPEGWRMGGILREEQVSQGDVLVALGGGAGVEHLAELYAGNGKPVVPIRAALGSINDDGRGGSNYLYGRAMSEPDSFLELESGSNAAARLTLLELTAEASAGALADDCVALLRDVRPPRAFYVRLLATDHSEFEEVESFFREVVDPVVSEAGYRPHEVGRDAPLAGFLNVEIFEGLHRAGVVIVDLTGVRPNCMMEFGYALGRGRRVIVTAKRGTALPFDPDKIPTHFWAAGTPADRQRAFHDWFERLIDMPALVA